MVGIFSMEEIIDHNGTSDSGKLCIMSMQINMFALSWNVLDKYI